MFTSILAILVLAGIFSFVFRPQIEFKVVVPDLIQAGQKIKADCYLTNLRVRSAFEVFLEAHAIPEGVFIDEAESIQLINVIRPGKTVREHLDLTYGKRGVYGLPSFWIGSSFPFNLFRFRQTKSPIEKIIVTPAFKALHHFELPSSNHSLDFESEKNVALAHAVGVSEYIGNREYQEGLPVRRWDYSSWARTGKPTVREYRENQRGTATIFVDNFFDRDQTSAEVTFEAILSLATAIADALSKAQIDINRLIIGSETFSVFDPNPEEQQRLVGRHLAMANRSDESQSQILSDEMLGLGLAGEQCYAFLIFNKWDESRAIFHRQFQYQHNACQVIVVDHESSANESISLTSRQIQQGDLLLK